MTDAPALLTALLRGAYGLLFLASGISKYLRQSSINYTIARYRLVPVRLVPVFSACLATLEIVAGALLLLSPVLPTYQLAWAMTTGLLGLFCIAIALALVRGLRIPCGCNWLLNGHTLTLATLLRNLLLLLPMLSPPLLPSALP
ncbi:MauE/DoxX family redox-associated membrane protein [Actimicrobium sp. CCC2.4]|uniref:MauE/DoxX family redox-associated membrane protein n=1 Tax=Actimicrobium sp. CCC2.4 TaxID=3048606 RepID=UPI002AC9580E|nr:MauE/DoxX family redox-associated membrane protein [Actimicrobium sp. CCC2.4]MEB0133835.1 MauE/DoxX family redox-associated membrane protein [Actimicrobium sp. CCC2.4]WPX31377.1 MauE/DoxX family redox-associated membrane protein [Actimicrobium sp. CCC2.4]